MGGAATFLNTKVAFSLLALNKLASVPKGNLGLKCRNRGPVSCNKAMLMLLPAACCISHPVQKQSQSLEYVLQAQIMRSIRHSFQASGTLPLAACAAHHAHSNLICKADCVNPQSPVHCTVCVASIAAGSALAARQVCACAAKETRV